VSEINAKARLLQGPPVAVLAGDEAPHGYPLLREWAAQLFKHQGGKANRPDIGCVLLDRRAVNDSMAHGMNPAKAAAFAAVKVVIEQGVVVLRARHSRDGESFYVSAPVRISRADTITTVLVRRDPNIQRMYLHSVISKENLLKTKYSGTDTAYGVERSGKATSGDIANILRGLLQVKLGAADANLSGAAAAGCVSLTSFWSVGCYNDGRQRPRPNAGFSYGFWIQKTIGCGPGAWDMRCPKMPDLLPLSKSSASCHLEWRPSRQERGCLWLLTLLGACSLLQCDLPLSLAWPAALVALGMGGFWLWRHRVQPPRECLIALDLAACRIDGEPVSRLDLRWRGPLLFMRWKHLAQRRWQHAVFWPDTLPVAKRRELRLAIPAVLTSITR